MSVNILSRVQVHLLLVGGDWGHASQSTRANHESKGRLRAGRSKQNVMLA